MDVGVAVSGERQVSLRFDQFPDRAHDALLRHITNLTARLLSRIELVVPRATGTLKSEVQSFVDDDPNKISGKVKVVAPNVNEMLKAQALEYGSHQRITVRMSASRSAISKRADDKVATYQRMTNITEHAMFRGPLEAMSAEISAELRQAMDEAAAE